ncbi:MAG: bifunctional pyr operon transcriptional regulator/uracil phosphoribosyltransferase PyrR [Deltaproteobacteria bacterium]|nr:MAG: bifunctional pyr operon transcriptional regulator/uracil phosphoribosyltransferase PyrR [Deltaproteobacteria bacterium]
MGNKKKILDRLGIGRILTRISHEIVERNKGVEKVVLVGIRTGGMYLAQRLQKMIKDIEGTEIPLGVVDITLYRDDLSRKAVPRLRETTMPFSLDDKRVILVDDVFYTGRSTRAAMDALMDFGRPECIQLAVLVDRGHQELPIRPDYVGMNVSTSYQESVEVMLEEKGDEDQVVVI